MNKSDKGNPSRTGGSGWGLGTVALPSGKCDKSAFNLRMGNVDSAEDKKICTLIFSASRCTSVTHCEVRPGLSRTGIGRWWGTGLLAEEMEDAAPDYLPVRDR